MQVLTKANQKLQVALNLPPTITTADDHFNAAKEYLEVLDENVSPERYITAPQEVAQAQITQLQQQIQQMTQQIEQGDKMLQKSTRGLAKTEKKADDAVSEAEGKIEAITGQ